MASIVYSVIVPMYNEEPVIEETYKRLSKVLQGMNEPYEIVFVNDGSRDKTLDIVRKLRTADNHIKIVNFARNFGHQIAVTAGLNHVSGQATLIIDADLQDPPELLPEMAKLWRQGYDVVYGQRKERKGDSSFKRFTAWGFYRLLTSMTGNFIPQDTGDFRLIDQKVVRTLCSMPEHARFMRGMVGWVGFKQTPIQFDRDARWAGETKYPLSKMLKLASDGIFSFSVKPLKLATLLGGAFVGGGLLYLLILLILLICGVGPGGYHVTNALLLLVGGAVLGCMGIFGEYVGRIYEETKDRPLYTIQSLEGFEGMDE